MSCAKVDEPIEMLFQVWAKEVIYFMLEGA